MASALRFSRRSMVLSSSLLRYRRLSSSSSASSSFYLSRRVVSATIIRNPSSDSNIQHRSFHSTTPAFNRRWDIGEEDKIKPDEILFEGCDYNHWLITMDFPKDPKPSPEEMVETYVQTAAKVLGSVEEAKKKIYACSTTTYEGFQVEVSEEMSEKFKGLPGVVFVLPDSYIDPVNKQYGGDKYDNGVITPRPPPIQYGRQGRYGDRNRNYDRPRYDRNRDSGMQQFNQPYARQGPMQGDGRNYAPQQNYGPPGDRRDFGPPGQSHGPPGERRDFGPPGQNYGPPGERRDFAPGQNYSPPGERRDFGPSGQSYGPPGERRDFGPPGQSYSSPGERRDFPQSGGSAPQGQVSPPETGDNRQGSGPGYSGDYRQGSGTDYTGGYRQGSGPSYGGGYRQGSGPGYSGDYRQGSGPGYSGDYRQGSGPGYSGDQSQRSGPGYGGDLRQGSGGFGGDNAQRTGSGYGGDATPGSASGYGQN